jgi:hypothetical protein
MNIDNMHALKISYTCTPWIIKVLMGGHDLEEGQRLQTLKPYRLMCPREACGCSMETASRVLGHAHRLDALTARDV